MNAYAYPAPIKLIVRNPRQRYRHWFGVPFRVSFDPEDLRIEGNPFRVNPHPESERLRGKGLS